MKEFDEYFSSYSSLKWDGDFTIAFESLVEQQKFKNL